MRRRGFVAGLAALAASGGTALRAQPAPATTSIAAPPVASRFFLTGDGVRLHYLDAGPANSRSATHTIVFVPGWTMPAWIWWPQLRFFSTHYRAIALDPRGQGDSDIAASGYEPRRRGQDIADLIAVLGGGPVLLVGWSLGVLDSLAFLHTHGDAAISGLVLVDNSVGEEPPPPPPRTPPKRRPKLPREVAMARFVRAMFHTPQSPAYLDQLTEATLRMPEQAASQLLAYPVPRSYWREAVYSTQKPVLYAVRPVWAAQARNLERQHPSAEIALFPDAGHALFIDDAARFDALMQDFIVRRIWV
jgi:microsomal epoxide hydrolase